MNAVVLLSLFSVDDVIAKDFLLSQFSVASVGHRVTANLSSQRTVYLRLACPHYYARQGRRQVSGATDRRDVITAAFSADRISTPFPASTSTRRPPFHLPTRRYRRSFLLPVWIRVRPPLHFFPCCLARALCHVTQRNGSCIARVSDFR